MSAIVAPKWRSRPLPKFMVRANAINVRQPRLTDGTLYDNAIFRPTRIRGPNFRFAEHRSRIRIIRLNWRYLPTENAVAVRQEAFEEHAIVLLLRHFPRDLHRGQYCHALAVAVSTLIHSVFKNAIRACLSGTESCSPNSCPFTARVRRPYPTKPVGT
jgi:hypothetical protein